MKKRAISFVLCLMMVVTLFGNGIPVYAANELEPPIVATEETSQDAPEESEAEGSPAVEASEAAHGEDTNAAGETSSEVAGTSETDETTEDETTEATDAEETAWAEEGTENKPPEAADTEESATVNTPETTEEAVAEEKPDAATPSEADRAAEEPEVPAPANAMLDSPEVDGIPIDEEHFPGKLFREWLLGQRENDPANPNVFGSDDGILTEKERAAVKEIRFQYNINTGNPPPEGGLDLTGIEYFPNLETLVTQHIEITNQLDLSQNTKLKLISLDSVANITYALDLSNQGELEKLTLNGNNIPSLDLSNNPKLTFLGLHADITKEGEGKGLISELDLSNNPALKQIVIEGHQITSLDLSNNKKLTNITIRGNNLTSLDVSMLPELEYLYLESNELREIDVTKNPRLERLEISGNADISSLDISQNPELKELYAQQTSLFFLDAKNNRKLEILFLDQNPLLGYEIVDGGTSLPITYNRFLDVVTVRATPDGTVDLSQLVPELDGSRISKLTGADKIEGTTLYGVKNGMDVTYNYRTRTAGDGSSNGMLARIHIVSEEPAAGAHTVNYEFKNLPAYRSLPQRVKDLLPAPQTDVADGTVVTPPELAVTQVKDLSGIWHFQGWDKKTATVDGADVTFTGTWKLTQYKTFFASYNFVPSKASMDKGHTTLPQEVIDLIPDAMEGLTDGQVITHPTPAKTEVEVDGGKWVFAGWPVGNTATVQNGNIVTVAEWNFVEEPDKPTMKFTVTFKFVSLTNGTDGKPRELPQEVLDLLPAPITNLEAGTHVDCPTLAKTEIPAEGGKWVFTGWPAGTGITGITITGSALVVGGWRFDKESTPVEVAKRVQLNVHTLVDGKKNFATKDMLEQMNPVLRAEDGQEVKPVRIADNGFTFDFEQVPAGEYTLAFTYPAGYRFAPGKVGSDMFGDYLDTGAKVTVTAGYVVNNFYTRLGKTPDEPNPPVNPPTEKTGNLTVTKTVSGSGGDHNKEFTFTVTLDKQDLNGEYGDMTFTGGVATFTLKHGQSKTANGLPIGVSYTVEESDNSGYTVTKTNAAGTIQTGSTATAAFENYKGSSGGSGGSGGSSGGDGGGSSSHTPQAARVTLTATKTMDGLIPTGSGFTFFLDDANGQRLQVRNNQGGNITFDTLTFNKTGTYVYYLTEQTGNDKNINYDTASYKVTVTVTCPYDYAASVSYEKNGQAYNSVPAFVNTTKQAAPAPAQTPPVITPARPLDKVPKTEDSSNLALWGILAAASLLSLTVLLAGTKTRKVRSQGKEHQS